MRFRVRVWGVSSSSVLPTPPLSAGAGLGNQAALSWKETRFRSFGLGLGLFLRFFVLPTPLPLSAGSGSGYAGR